MALSLLVSSRLRNYFDMNRYGFLHDYVKPEFPIFQGSRWIRTPEGKAADREICDKRSYLYNQVYPEKITIQHDDARSIIPYSEPLETGWFVGGSCTISTRDILRYYVPDPLCVCGHPESEHADVPAISKDSCWTPECGCYKFKPHE